MPKGGRSTGSARHWRTPAKALERLHRTWDAGVREAISRLDELVAQVDEAVRLTRVLAEQRRRPTS